MWDHVHRLCTLLVSSDIRELNTLISYPRESLIQSPIVNNPLREAGPPHSTTGLLALGWLSRPLSISDLPIAFLPWGFAVLTNLVHSSPLITQAGIWSITYTPRPSTHMHTCTHVCTHTLTHKYLVQMNKWNLESPFLTHFSSPEPLFEPLVLCLLFLYVLIENTMTLDRSATCSINSHAPPWWNSRKLGPVFCCYDPEIFTHFPTRDLHVSQPHG